MSSTAASSSSADPQWPGADRVSVAVAFPGALTRLAPGRVVHRGADLDDRLHPPHGHVRSRHPTGELVDLALEAVSRPRPPPAGAEPYGAAHGFHRRLDPCDRPARRTDPAVLVLAAARSRSSASASGSTRAPDLARLRSGAKVNAGCPGKHIKANRCRGRAARMGGAIPMACALGEVSGLSRNQAAEGLELSTACMANGTASDIASSFCLQIASISALTTPQRRGSDARKFR